MGTWSHEPFGNDTANDWAYELEGATDLSLVEEALDKVLSAEEYLEAPEAEEAVAAVEVLAKLLGKGTQSDSYTKKVEAWVAELSVKPPAELRKKAGRALDRVLGANSELRDLWQESGEGNEWEQSVERLKAAVAA